MLDIILQDASEVRKQIALRARERRLFFNITQQELANRSGVSLGSIRRFEATGLISLSSLIEISIVLDCKEEFASLFPPPHLEVSLYK